MTFAKQLELHLDRILGSSAEKRQRAEACGIDYNYYVMIASGAKNPPSDEKILEIAQKLKLSDHEAVNLMTLAIRDKAKEPETKGILARALEAMEKRTAATNDFTKQKTPANVIALKAETHTIPIYTTIKAGNGEMGTSNSDLYKQVDQVNRQITETEEKQIALVEEFASGNMPKAIVQKAVEKAEMEKAGLLKRLETLQQEIIRTEGLKVTSRDVCEFAAIARCSIEDAEGLPLKNMFTRFGVTVSISRNSAKIKVSPAVFADDTDTFGAGDGRLKISVSCLARNIQFAQSKRIYHNHHSDHKAR